MHKKSVVRLVQLLDLKQGPKAINKGSSLPPRTSRLGEDKINIDINTVDSA